jgi:hypothetical protein
MRRLFFAAYWLLVAVFAAAIICGCGSTPSSSGSHPQTKPSTLTFSEPNGTRCVTRIPPSMGECVAQAERAAGHNPTLAAPRTEHQQCADWSIYQGGEPNTSGLHCVIIQAAYGLNVERSVYSQINDARRHGIPYGVYDFGEPGIYAGYELAFIHRLAAGAPLGYWFDAEVSGVFWRSCEFTSEAQALGLRIFGVFSYPGGYAAGGGTRCAGLLWASEWGVSGPYPFGGYTASAIVLWQDCGTCDRFGVTTDLDVDEGLIALTNPPKPKPKPKPHRNHRQLEAYLRAVDRLLGAYSKANPHGHNCANPPYHHAYSSARFDPACAQWAREARETHNALR